MNKNSIKHEIFRHNFATFFLNFDNLVISQALLLQPVSEFDDFRLLGSTLFMNKIEAVAGFQSMRRDIHQIVRFISFIKHKIIRKCDALVITRRLNCQQHMTKMLNIDIFRQGVTARSAPLSPIFSSLSIN